MTQLVLTAETYYRAVFDISAYASGIPQLILGGGLFSLPEATGVSTIDFVAASTGINVRADQSTADFTSDSISVKEILFTPDALGDELNQAVA